MSQHNNSILKTILKKKEGVVQSAFPGQAINGDRGQLAVEDREQECTPKTPGP